MSNALFENTDKVHATEAAARRIEKNMGLAAGEAVPWCMRHIENPDSLTRGDKHWNVRGDGFVIVVDAQSYAVVTARREKQKRGDSLAGVHIIKKLDDVPELKNTLIGVFNTKTHRNVSQYGLLLADHIMQAADLPMNAALLDGYGVNQRWREGEAGFQEARDAAGAILDLAREEKCSIKEKALRAMAQIAAIPHVKRHALIASDYAVKMINLMHPGDREAVQKERALQITLMESV